MLHLQFSWHIMLCALLCTFLSILELPLLNPQWSADAYSSFALVVPSYSLTRSILLTKDLARRRKNNVLLAEDIVFLKCSLKLRLSSIVTPKIFMELPLLALVKPLILFFLVIVRT